MRNFKPVSTTSALRLGIELRNARITLEQTLSEASKKTKIDTGQLSRFERGYFKAISFNLQKYAKYLQIKLDISTEPLEERFRAFAQRSVEHRDACELILEALERLK